jgi:hypothetical protein
VIRSRRRSHRPDRGRGGGRERRRERVTIKGIGVVSCPDSSSAAGAEFAPRTPDLTGGKPTITYAEASGASRRDGSSHDDLHDWRLAA